MKKILVAFFLLVSFGVFSQKKIDKSVEKIVVDLLDGKTDQYANIAHKIWEFAEVGYQEYKSSALLQEQLKMEGFDVKAGVAGIPTAFTASFGNEGPVIALLAEFDALPGLAQNAVPERSPIEGQRAGQACGHHLFGTAVVAAAVATKKWLQETGFKGTIRVYGTPAEEGGGGKVYMVREGLFKDVDVVLHWHPGNANQANPGYSLANKTGKFRFYGISAHASGAPEQGRSALDALEAMNFMLNMMREHVTPETRIHYIVTKGGDAPNIVPGFAEGYYYVRHPDIMEVKDLWERMVKCAEGAALGTGTRMEYEVVNGVYNLLPNETLAKVMHKNLSITGGYTLSQDEMEFARKIQETLVNKVPLTSTNTVIPMYQETGGGSTDVGDVSWVVPTQDLSTATWVPGTPAHSWQAVAAGGMSIGHKGMMIAAESIFRTAVDLYKSPATIEAAWTELRQRTGEGFVYESLIGDRKPPLDYRN